MSHFHRCPDCGCDTRCPAPDSECTTLVMGRDGVVRGKPVLDESCARRRVAKSRGEIREDDTR